MPRICPTDWKTLIRIFEKFGCTVVRKHGDHWILDHPNARRPVIIPAYDEIAITIIKTNMKTVGMTREQYFEILEEI